jgi:hypothetical protein
MGADGIPDWDNDFDGDRRINLDEFALGTNPANGWLSISPFTLTAEMAEDGSGVVLIWDGKPQVTYQVQESVDLLNWADIPGLRRTGNAVGSEPLNLKVRNVGDACYFRVRVSK